MQPDDVSEDAIVARLYAPELPDPDLVIRTSGEQRISNFLLWQSAYAELVFDDTLWPDFGEERLRVRARGVREPRAKVRRAGEPACSRASSSRRSCSRSSSASSTSAAGGSSASRSSEGCSRCTSCTSWLATCGRSSSAATSGSSLTLLGLQLGGLEWMLGGLLATFVFAFVVYGLGGVRQSATTSFGVTLLGVAWVGAGIGCLLLDSRHPGVRVLGGHGGSLHRVRGRHGRVLRRPHVRTPSHGAGDLAEEVVGGVRRRRARRGRDGLRDPLQGSRRLPLDPASRCSWASSSRSRRCSAISSSRR